MTICPVCEHAQEGNDECTVCGRPFLRPQPQGEIVQPLADLEPTRVEPQTPTMIEPMADLAPTRHDAMPEAATAEGSAPWLEQTSLPRQAAPERDVFALATCRYCRTPASPDEVFCSRCGLKLAVYAREAPTTAGADVRQCRFCGAAGVGRACRSCGARF